MPKQVKTVGAVDAIVGPTPEEFATISGQLAEANVTLGHCFAEIESLKERLAAARAEIIEKEKWRVHFMNQSKSRQREIDELREAKSVAGPVAEFSEGMTNEQRRAAIEAARQAWLKANGKSE